MAARLINQVNMFACSTGMSYRGLERQGMANLRYHVHGEREIIVADFGHLSDYAGKIGLAIELGQDYFHYIETVIDTL